MGSACELALKLSCDETACADNALVMRPRLEMRRMLEAQGSTLDTQGPAIFMGRIASSDTAMKSGKDRDKVILAQKVMAFEMEAAGM